MSNELLQPISLPQTAIGFHLYLMLGLGLMLAGSILLVVQWQKRHA